MKKFKPYACWASVKEVVTHVQRENAVPSINWDTCESNDLKKARVIKELNEVKKVEKNGQVSKDLLGFGPPMSSTS